MSFFLGERPYKCHLPECGRAFIQLSNLQQHLRNHDAQVERAKNRPFHCNICGKGFATESSLRTHTSKVSHVCIEPLVDFFLSFSFHFLWFHGVVLYREEDIWISAINPCPCLDYTILTVTIHSFTSNDKRLFSCKSVKVKIYYFNLSCLVWQDNPYILLSECAKSSDREIAKLFDFLLIASSVML